MKPLSPLVEAMPRSGIRELMARATLVPDAIRLEAGEPSFPTPAHIIDAAYHDAQAGYTKYTAGGGLLSLREVLAAHTSRAWGRAVAVENVMVTHGAVGALMSVVMALLDDGDEVLVPDPCWPNYLNIVKMGRATAVPFSLRAEAGYLPDLAEMHALITPRTKAIMINTPGNPTGAVFPPELVKGLVDLAIEHDLYLVSDEVYEALVFEGQHFSTAQCDLQHVIAISSVSKTYAMTGWRLGWAVGDPKVIALATKLHEMLLSCPSSVSQRAAEAALTGPQDSVARMRDAYRARRDLVVDLLKAHDLLGSVPHGAFYAMVDLRHLRRPSLDLALALLDEQHVAVAPGSTFGQVAEGMVRISLAAADDQLREGCRRIIGFAGRG